MMKYKGYTGEVSYDNEARIFHGDVIGIKAVITFQGKTVDELEHALKDSIDTYIEWCKKRNVEPEKPFSGNLNIKISPKTYERLAQAALEKNMSFDSFIIEKLISNLES